MDTLHFEDAERLEPGEGEIEVRVHGSSVNYKDILKIEGRIHPVALENTLCEGELGVEVSGEVLRAGKGSRFANGDRVVALVSRGFRSYVTMPDTLAAKIPGDLAMEAAAVPFAYLFPRTAGSWT